MSTNVWTGICVAMACAATVGLAAHAPRNTQSPSTKPHESIIIVGCVQRADQAVTGTSGSKSSAAAAPTQGAAGTSGSTMTDTFLLTNVTTGGSAASAQTGTAGSTAGSQNAVASSYRLDSDESKLSPHVGHKVEIIGVVENAAPASATSPRSSSPSTPSASALSAPRVKVETVRMIAANCSE